MNVEEAVYGRNVPETIRVFCRFDGRVQGVGFRWTMQRLAQDAGVSGWVHNEDDGTVTCELQGPGTAVVKVLRGMDREYAKSRAQSRGFFSRAFMNLAFNIAECTGQPVDEEDTGLFRVR